MLKLFKRNTKETTYKVYCADNFNLYRKVIATLKNREEAEALARKLNRVSVTKGQVYKVMC